MEIKDQETLWSVDRFEEKYGEPGGAYDECSAFTVAELGEILPKLGGQGWIETIRFLFYWRCASRVNSSLETHAETSETEADARAKTVVYLLENRLADFSGKWPAN